MRKRDQMRGQGRETQEKETGQRLRVPQLLVPTWPMKMEVSPSLRRVPLFFFKGW